MAALCGNATAQRRIQSLKKYFPILHQTQGITQNFAGIAITAAGKLGLDERFKVFAEGKAAGHVCRLDMPVMAAQAAIHVLPH
jgi:hypothetical protein